MTYFRDLMKDSEAAARSHLFVGEEVLATGRLRSHHDDR